MVWVVSGKKIYCLAKWKSYPYFTYNIDRFPESADMVFKFIVRLTGYR